MSYPTIDRIESGLYFIPLDEVLTDSMHGAMHGFEIITARVVDSDGAEGVGYTYTCGHNGGEVHDILNREIPEIALGEDAGRIEAAWKEHVETHRADTMESAVALAARLARPGDIVLLSPACASFDMYRDFEDRGRHFKNLVLRLE